MRGQLETMPHMHLVIPFALVDAAACRGAAAGLRLPYLEQLLRRLRLEHTDRGEAGSWSTPSERVLARVHRLPGADGCIPWAAWRLADSGRATGTQAWAELTPCHLNVAASHIRMDPPQQLQLEADESRSLLDAMRPYFEEDGITLEYDSPCRWLACGELFRGLAAASTDRVAGRDIEPWYPAGAQSAGLRRLQNEMQMLLYMHPLNDARSARAVPTVNAFWVSGCGAAPDSAQAQPGTTGAVVEAGALRAPALAGDWFAWSAAWRELDNTDCAALIAAVRGGTAVTVSLCGESNALQFGPAQAPALARWIGQFKRASLYSLRDML